VETAVKEIRKISISKPFLVEGLPGLGMVGRIATRYLAKQLKAQRFAFLYSPHFPYYVIVNRKGNARLLRGGFRYWNNPRENDLIFFTGDSQAQTIEGQYEVAETILSFAGKYNVEAIFTLGGFRKETSETPRVFATATDDKILEKAIKAGATQSPPGNPIVGTAGLLIGMAKFKSVPALCLLGETRGYLPDPKAAKSILTVLQKMLRIPVTPDGLDKEIAKADRILEKMRQIEARRETYAKRMRRSEEGKTTYIS
jgi:uncharacterized protein (TIGR00162 family)